MSKTGGGRGTNQYRIRGTSNAPTHVSRHQHTPPTTNPDEVFAAAQEPHPSWSEQLARYPTAPADYQADPEAGWDEHRLLMTVRDITPRGTERAVARYLTRQHGMLRDDAALEGIAFTAPEISTLLSGGHVPGHTEGENAQVLGLKKASDFLIERVREGHTLEPSQALADDLHLFIAAPLGLRSIEFRGDQRVQYEGPAVNLGRGERFRALDARLTHTVLEEGLERISALPHPVLRGVTWAAFATYHQFYLDGNKRTARYAMNAVLMSHGYDAILIPNRDKANYADALVDAYRTADLTEHILFLLSHYHDSHEQAGLQQ